MVLKVSDSSDLWYTEVVNTDGRDPLCLHMFAKEISDVAFLQIQQDALTRASDQFEVLGTVRVPVYILENGEGLPLFLKN